MNVKSAKAFAMTNMARGIPQENTPGPERAVHRSKDTDLFSDAILN